MKRSITIFFVAATVLSCAPKDDNIESERGVSVQALRGASDLESVFLGFDLLVTDGGGQAIACDDANLSLTFEVSFDQGQTFTDVPESSIDLVCGQTAAPQVAMVLDNSGSQETVLDTTKVGAQQYMDAILAAGGSGSVVRVSTQSIVHSPLTDDATALTEAIDDLFVTNGWTALYDGVRLGNETLGEGLADQASVAYDSLQTFCNDSPKTAIVVFTNGEENNSADQEHGDDSDGIDTSLEDLKELKVQSTHTPVYSIGLGPRTDQATLQELADSTGGKHIQIQDLQDLPAVFDFLSDYPSATTQVCGELSSVGCGDAVVRIGYDYVNGENSFNSSNEYNVYVPCPVDAPQGKVASILLTLSNPGVNADHARILANNAVGWVSAVPDPKVLVVKDDNHHNEFSNDPDFIVGLLQAEGVDATLFVEPKNGTTADDLNGYDVVWYSNPGWPIDERSSFDALRQFSASGHGIVMQGDDMSWSMGKAFPTNDLVHLQHKNNGVKTCGKKTDNNQGKEYEVTISANTHPITAGLEGATFRYGNDIDHSDPAGDGEEIWATATLADSPNCNVTTPVLVTYDPG